MEYLEEVGDDILIWSRCDHLTSAYVWCELVTEVRRPVHDPVNSCKEQIVAETRECTK